MATTALITGIAGQDGSYLAEHLLRLGYSIVGLTRDVQLASTKLGESLTEAIRLDRWDMQDQAQILELLERYQPDEIYNLAGRATGSGMFSKPVELGLVNGVAVTRLLEAIRARCPSARFLQASSAEMFGDPAVAPQTEETPFNPHNPYAAAKLYAHTITGIYRNRHGVHASAAILFNHESPRRSPDFVTRHVSLGAARIKLGLSDALPIGNLDARRDWGYAGDYVQAMHAMLQQDDADDYLIATGQTHSVRELCEIAFSHIDLDYRKFIVADPSAYREERSVQMVGDARKAREALGWAPTLSFESMIQIMVDSDLEHLESSKKR